MAVQNFAGVSLFGVLPPFSTEPHDPTPAPSLKRQKEQKGTNIAQSPMGLKNEVPASTCGSAGYEKDGHGGLPSVEMT